ncbi:MAG: ribbon-helix-helix domain-containing protein [Nanoarchaeota archaeon]|nr:ribbon-helix-helix domain-containing protein [Nanoarchaeota archaeon]
MVMDTLQIRLGHGLVEFIDAQIKKGIYSSRSDYLRDIVRKQMALSNLNKMVGIIPNTGDSVKEVREIRKKLSKEKFDLDEINNL